MKKLLTAVAMLVALGGPAVAQGTCGIYASMIVQLDMKYGETRWGAGMSGPQVVFELWASVESPYTWTLLKVYPSGQACIMAVGDNWQVDPPVVPGEST